MRPANPVILAGMRITPYDEIRDKLLTGDVVFCAGRYWFSRLISLSTGSPITHAGIVIRLDEVDRVLLLEAVEVAGVRLQPLSRLADSYRGMVFVARGCVGDIESAATWGMDQLAKPYSYLTIAALALRILRGSGRRGDPDKRGYVCSEFAARWLALAGETDLFPDDTIELLTPADLWEHSSMELLARLH